MRSDDLEALDPELFTVPEGADHLREMLWAQTSRIQRGRRARRRVTQVGALAVLYLLGFLTARSLPARGQPEAPPVAALPAWHADVQPVPQPRIAAPDELEVRARSGSRRRRPERLRRAGDLYLSERGDVSAALRCYRELLDLLPEEDRLAVGSGDSWLLAALKRDLNPRS